MGLKNKKDYLNFNLRNDNSKNISRTFSGSVADLMGSVHFQIVPWSGLYLSRSVGPILCSQY